MSGSIRLTLPLPSGSADIFNDSLLAFLATLEQRFGEERRVLLKKRADRQASIDAGKQLDFLPETKSIRESEWQIAPLPERLKDRRVEITGPADRKMMINALNSGATCCMTDLEDSSTPTWENIVAAQVNLYDACRQQLDFFDEEKQKDYQVESPGTATLMVRPRGLHLEEKHLELDGNPLSGSLVDFGGFVFHNAQILQERGEGPFLYLPKLEHYEEAAWWCRVFDFAEAFLGIEAGTIKATVLVETLPLAFQMDEVLHALGIHAAGLNCGRWDYLFSFIKTYREHQDKVLPDRSFLTMTCPNMRAYSRLAIKTCHRRGAMCIGGMAAEIPVKDDEKANERALAKVTADKKREYQDGHDGSWVAHPGLVGMVNEIFSARPDRNNQLDIQIDDTITAADLLAISEGEITEAGLRHGIQISLYYIESWLRGIGCVPIFNLMEDAATAEISRAQIWQWIHHEVSFTDGGGKIDEKTARKLIQEEVTRIKSDIGADQENYRFDEAAQMFSDMSTASTLDEFLTLKAYDKLVEEGK